MKKAIMFVVQIVLITISFIAGAIFIHVWWIDPSEHGEINRTKDEICKKHNITLIDENNNVYGKERKIKLHKKSIHTMNKIGF